MRKIRWNYEREEGVGGKHEGSMREWRIWGSAWEVCGKYGKYEGSIMEGKRTYQGDNKKRMLSHETIFWECMSERIFLIILSLL